MWNSHQNVSTHFFIHFPFFWLMNIDFTTWEGKSFGEFWRNMRKEFGPSCDEFSVYFSVKIFGSNTRTRHANDDSCPKCEISRGRCL
jgi:hypothetical protein